MSKWLKIRDPFRFLKKTKKNLCPVCGNPDMEAGRWWIEWKEDGEIVGGERVCWICLIEIGVWVSVRQFVRSLTKGARRSPLTERRQP